MKELEKNELMRVDGGGILAVLVGLGTATGVVLGMIAGAVAVELITEGFEKCAADFKEGYNSTQH